MAICALHKDMLRTNSCGYSLPTITDIFVANYADVTSTAISAGTGTTDAGCETVTGITMNAEAKFYHIEPTRNSISFSDALTVDDTNGNKYRTHSVTFSVSGVYDACQHANLDALSLGRYIVVVKTAEGSYLMLGRLNPLEASAAELAGGSDSNGMTITLDANVTESAIPLSEEAIQTVLGEGE